MHLHLTTLLAGIVLAALCLITDAQTQPTDQAPASTDLITDRAIPVKAAYETTDVLAASAV